VTRPPWRTNLSTGHREHLTWPSPAQVLRQIAMVVVIIGLWGILLAGFLSLAGAGAPPPAAALSRSETRVIRPTFTPTSLPANTSTPTVPVVTTATVLMPTDTPAPTMEPALSLPTDMPLATATATLAAPTPTATPMPSPTPTPLSGPTMTPVPPASPVTPSDGATTVSFSRDVLPILERRCVKCHGGEKTEEGLVLKTYADVMKGSNNGPVINPGNVEDSLLISQIVNGKMPKREPRLLPAEIRLITAWVEAGAPDN
jgi:hypothetical protein